MARASEGRKAVFLRDDLAVRLKAAADERFLGRTILLDKAVERFLEDLLPVERFVRTREDLIEHGCSFHPTPHSACPACRTALGLDV